MKWAENNQQNIGIGAFIRAQCKASKGQAESPNPMEHPTLFLAQNNPFNPMAKILSMIHFLMKKHRQPLDQSLGFHSR
jgi:hypothetical protein